MSQKSQRSILIITHELNSTGQHRLVASCSDGTNSAGEWTPTTELATHLDLFACADPTKGLPEVFKVRDVQYQVLA